MNRHFLVIFFGMAICLFSFLSRSTLQAEDIDSNTQITTQEQAAEFASKLANEKCKESFGKSPFAPDSYVAQLLDSRWNWGKIEPPGIHGFSAEIGFNVDGSDRKVRVVLHTDALGIVAPGSKIKRK
jgi:hypothetical protein